MNVSQPSTSTCPTLEVSIPTKIYSHVCINKNESCPAEEGSTSGSEDWIKELIELPSTEKRSQTNVELNKPIFNKYKRIIMNLKTKLETKTKKLALYRTQICKLKTILKKMRNVYKNELSFMNYTYIMKWSKTLVKMQLKKKKRAWQDDEKKFALILHYKSPAAYKYLRRMIVLPSISSIKMWIGQTKCTVGINQEFVSQLKLKFETMDANEKKCSILFDEMNIKTFFEYNKCLDFIEGYEDLGEMGRTGKPAKSSLVFMARGIFSSWKLPLCYFLTNSGSNSCQLQQILLKVLKVCLLAGLNVKCIICDQAPQNQKLFKLLQITKEKPYFSLNDKTIYGLYDSLHLVKNFRNNLLNGNYMYSNKVISFDIIREVYKIDRNKQCRALIKLTDKHINPSIFDRMNVKLAVQVFSHSMAAAIRTCIDTEELKMSSAASTADFIGKFS